MTQGITVKTKVQFGTGRRSRKEIRMESKPESPPPRVPRIAKLMALAIRFDQMVRNGEVADLARSGHVTRARLTQIMNLLNLASDIQEVLLFLPPVERGKDSITERQLRAVAAEGEWKRRRRTFGPAGRAAII